MARVLCVHRQKPNWPATADRPRFEVVHDGVTYWVETDGGEPSVAEMLAVTGPEPDMAKAAKKEGRSIP